MAKFLLFLLYIIAFLLDLQRSCEGKVIMEYIGATGKPVKLDDVPIQDGIDFHFILAFAIDTNPSGKPQNGNFAPYWSSNLTPESVAAIKAQYSNVKVLASLSGWSLNENIVKWYIPDDSEQWISNAFSSLKNMIETYNLDGIDIDYETFGKHDKKNFAYCIGELITRLKNQKIISVATIAPYFSTVSHYTELYKDYSDVIDFVNYQFYTEAVSTPEEFVEVYKQRAGQFDEKKLLPSYEVTGSGFQGDAFFEALSLLEENGLDLNGVMIFEADDSANIGYFYEKKAQKFLLNSSSL